MFRHYIEVVRRVRPRFVLLENVQGIRFPFGKHSEKDGTTGMRYSERIKTALEEDYQVFDDVIDAEGFGVPQRRVRYILVGVRRDDGRCESCPDPFQILSSMRSSFVRERKLSQLLVSVRDAIGDLRRSTLRTIESPDSPGFMHGRHQAPKSAYQRLMHARPAGTPADSHRFARHTPEVREKFLWFLKNCRKGKKLSAEDRGPYANRKHTVHVLHPAFAAPTVTTLPDDMIHYAEPRILTVREMARLQSFPDWFEFKGKYTTGGRVRTTECPRYTQVGNAVPPLLAEALGICISNLSEAISDGRPEALGSRRAS